MFDLSGKVAIVTGASRGLGKAMAIGLAKAGASVVVTDVIDVKDTVYEINKLSQNSFGLKVDVTKVSHIKSMVKKTLKKFSKIDILVNNAGVYWPGPSEDIKEKTWDKLIDINLKGQFLCAQEVGKQMIKQKSGNIINIASIAGLFGFAQSAAYCASKGGIVLLTKTLASDWGKHNIRVNAICPGIFATPMTDALLGDENFKQMVKTQIPMARYATPNELVGTAIYLASDASTYTTGHALVVDGGWTAAL